MAFELKPASGIGQVTLVVSTTSGTPTTMHTMGASDATARISVWFRNIGTTAQSVFVRISDGTTVGAYQEFEFPAPTEDETNYGAWVLQEIVVKGDGTAAPMIQAYADTTNEFECMITSTEKT